MFNNIEEKNLNTFSLSKSRNRFVWELFCKQVVPTNLKGKKMNCVEMIGSKKVTEETKGLYTYFRKKLGLLLALGAEIKRSKSDRHVGLIII